MVQFRASAFPKATLEDSLEQHGTADEDDSYSKRVQRNELLNDRFALGGGGPGNLD